MRVLPLASVLGSLLFATACTPPGGPAAERPAEAAEPAPAPASPAAATANFRCGDLLLGVAFDNTAGTATLSWSGQRRSLPRAVAASGARYADDSGYEFWNKGDGGTLTLAGGAAVDCVATEDVSPWDAARARGVAFRAIGTEPGWLVEVDGGDAPALRAELDYGERSLEATAVEAAADGSGYHATAADGTRIELAIQPGDCSDGMSDQTYPARVELTEGGRTLQGCGAFLDR
jgi:uncharacterized membrane protein